MNAAHFLRRCDPKSSNLLTLTLIDRAQSLYESGNWDFSVKDAQALIGGMLFLHLTKADLSTFGGAVPGFHEIMDPSYARPGRIIFKAREIPALQGKERRGKSHPRAACGGLIDI